MSLSQPLKLSLKSSSGRVCGYNDIGRQSAEVACERSMMLSIARERLLAHS